MQGGKNLSAAGKVPNLINKVKKLVCRRDGRIFVTGFEPDFDVVGRHMVEVIESTHLLSYNYIVAIFDYLKA